MNPGDEIRVRLPSEQSYRTVRLATRHGNGWWEAWLDKYGYTWSHLGWVHETWQKGQKRDEQSRP